MKKILVIDNQKDNLATIKAAIKNNMPDCKILTALSGTKGIKIARDKLPDTILLNIILPAIDGFEVCRILKADESTKSIPVIMTTTIETDSESRVKALNLGADAFLCQPIDPIELTAQVNVMLRIKEVEDKLREEKGCLNQKIEERDKKLNESEEKYRLIYEGAKDGLILVNKTLEIVSVNPAFTEITGLSEEAVVRKPSIALAKKFVNSKQLPQVLKYTKNLLANKPTKQLELNYQEKIFEVSTNKHAGGFIVGIIRDITKRKQAEEALKTSEDRLKVMFKSAPDAYFISDLKGNFVDGNKAGEELTGYKKEEMIGKNVFNLNLLTVKQFPKVTKTIAKSIIGQRTKPTEYTLNRKDGSQVFVEISTSPVKIKNKTVILGIARNIYERKKAEKALLESEEKLRLMIDNSPIGVSATDLKGHFLEVNSAMCKMVGYSRDEMIGKHFNQFSHPNDLASNKKLYEDLVTEKTTFFDLEKRYIHKTGRIIHILLRAQLVSDDKGKPLFEMAIIEDITQRKLVEKAHKKSEERYKDLVEKAGIAVITEDREGKFIFFNERFTELFGYSAEEIKSRSIQSLVYPDDVKRVMQLHNQRLQGKQALSRYEFRGVRKDGSIIYLEVDSIAHKENDRIIGSNSYIWDITARKQTERTLKENEQKLRNIFENSTNLFYSHSPDNVINYLSPQVEDILGYTQEEAMVEWTNFLSDNPANKIGYEKTEEAIKTGKQQPPYELELVKKNGDRIWVEVREFPQVKDGRTVAIIGSISDITERKHAEQIQNVLYNIFNAVTTTDNLEHFIGLIQKELGAIVDTTNFYVALYNHETGEITAPFFDDEKDNFTSIPAGKTLTRYVIDTKKPLLADIAIKKKMVSEGKLEHVGSLSKVWLGVPLKMGGKIAGVFAVQSYTDKNAFDKTDMKILEFVSDQISLTIHRKKAEEDLRIALERATESDRLKSAFLANMSHEIRTPMNGILGFADLLKEPGLTGSQQQEYIEIIEKSGDRLLSTINDIVDFSKIEAGQMVVSVSDINVNEQIDFIYAFFKPEAESKGLQFTIKNELHANNVVIKTDYEKLNSILTNLIKNAIKYTRAGSIEFGCNIQPNNPTKLQFYIKDTGIGVLKEMQEAIFDRFVQAEIEDRGAFQGSGLGLSISKAFVEMLGGRIWMESEPKVGSTFYFTIPFKEVKEVEKVKKLISKETIKQGNYTHKTILIVEDVEVSFHLIKLLLEKWEVNTIWAKNGEEAIKYCEKNSNIDLVLMDINMPGMNGYTASKKILQFLPNLPIIAQTAYALEGDREKSIAAGCIDYISKPVNKDELFEIIGKYI